VNTQLSGPPTEVVAVEVVPSRRTRPAVVGHRDWRSLAARLGVIGSLAVAVIVFSALRPHAFMSLDNARSILATSSPLAILAVGLTVVLVIGEFDLSIGAMVGLSSALSVILIDQKGTSWIVAVLVALAVGAAVGILNGVLIAYGGAPSFITTLAVGTALTGFEFLLTDQRSILSSLPATFQKLGGSHPVFNLSSFVLFAAGFALLAWIVLQKTEIGRYMYAVGANREASRLSGLRVRPLTVLGFVIVALSASLVGVLLSSQTSSYTPNSGTAYLLPAFAAAFLGAAAARGGRFNVGGTLVGVLLLGVIRTGLTMLQLSTAIVNIVQGTILIGAMLLTRLEKR
jgi:ribose transport system permease protein